MAKLVRSFSAGLRFEWKYCIIKYEASSWKRWLENIAYCKRIHVYILNMISSIFSTSCYCSCGRWQTSMLLGKRCSFMRWSFHHSQKKRCFHFVLHNKMPFNTLLKSFEWRKKDYSQTYYFISNKLWLIKAKKRCNFIFLRLIITRSWSHLQQLVLKLFKSKYYLLTLIR